MTGDAPDAVTGLLDDLGRWADGLLALGWAACGERQLEQARGLIARLEQANLGQCAAALGSLVRLLEQSSQANEALNGEIADAVGRLCIAVELTRERWEIERLSDRL